jgi:uroporphyrinogen III methyltransferase/synthase
MKVGTVYLVGAGPGDPGLLTLRGRDCIAAADVIIHDHLVDPRLLRLARKTAEIVSAGKRSDAAERDLRQQAIRQRMIAAARAGRVVVRLEGGDPFVFGQGGEEAQALADAGIHFEVVPGVSSAIAVPAYAGIPLTERGLNSSFSVVTGREVAGTQHPIDWPALARMETIVFLMGLKRLRRILDALTEAGKPPGTPAACIRSGTLPGQRTVLGTIADLADLVEGGVKSPAVVVVGDVVKRRESLQWYERRPLFGRRIVVTRAAEQASELVDRLERLGAEAFAAPTIELDSLERHEQALDRALCSIETFDWIIFTSAHGVEVFFQRLATTEGDSRRLGCTQVAAIGPGTARALSRYGVRADWVPDEFRAEALADGLATQVRGKRVLLPRAEGARDVLPKSLERAGAQVVDVGIYRARPPASLPQRVRELLGQQSIDAITFTSSSTVRHFHGLLGEGATSKMRGAAVACIGPITAETARGLGWRVDVEAREYTTEGLVEALIDYFASRG